MPSKTQLKVFIYTMENVGHVNACLGIGQSLRKRGHQVIFLVEKVWQGKLDHFDFTFEYFADEAKECSNTEKPGQHLSSIMTQVGMIGKGDSATKYKNINKFSDASFDIEKLKHHELVLKERIDKYNPDVFILDHFNLSPFINYSGKPWVRIVSCTPFFFELDFHMIPPAGSGICLAILCTFSNNSLLPRLLDRW